MRALDLSGQIYGRLSVESLTTIRGQRAWICVCECGTRLTVIQAYLRCGDTQSCGCLQVDRVRKKLLKHGEAPIRNQSREYVRWQHAKSRCYNSDNPSFPDYGGRGIIMSPEWREDFAAFLRDMGRCPVGHSLDRIDNNGPYSRDNCRWTTSIEQQNNKRTNRQLTLHTTTHTAAQWSRLTGINAQLILARIDKFHWTVEEALTTPVRKRH